MLSKTLIKHIRSLHQAKFRKAYNLFLAEGPKLASEMLHSHFEIDSLFATGSWIELNQQMLPDTLEVIQVSNRELERISTLKTPNEVVSVVKVPADQKYDPVKMARHDLVLVLDEIKDPGNLGTIIRTADWFGIRLIVCSSNCVELYNPKVVQSTMGSIARVPVMVTDLSAMFRSNPEDIPVYGAVLDGRNMYDEKLPGMGFLVIGSESHGISGKILPHLTKPISIPAHTHNKGTHAESLNASVATAILCAEFRRVSK